MIVVSDTSPIANLAAIGQADLLHRLYGKVIIPSSVRGELLRASQKHPAVAELAHLDWVDSRQASNQTAVASLELELDRGEAEAIILATELQADLFLMDERKGRAIATRLGLRVIGLMAVLVEAKRGGLLPAVKPVLDDLIGKAGFWISAQLYEEVLRTTGE